MDQTVSWIATAATIIAACFTASNLGSRVTGIGFIIFTIGSIAWIWIRGGGCLVFGRGTLREILSGCTVLNLTTPTNA